VADNSLVKYGLFAGAAYLAYRQGWLSFLGLGGPTVVTAPPANGGANPPATGSTAEAIPPPSVLSGIFSRIQSKAGAVPLNADEWNWYLSNELAALGKGAAPDPVPIFGLDRSQPLPEMSFDQYKAKMQAYYIGQGFAGYLRGRR
jgi:hypothetical protein